MSESLTLRETIIEILQYGSVPSLNTRRWLSEGVERTTAADRAYLAPWLKHVDDPIWSKILIAAQLGDPHLSYLWLVWIALRANRRAESACSGTDPLLERQQKERRDCLEAVDRFEWLDDFYGRIPPDIAAKYAMFFRPVDTSRLALRGEAAFWRRCAGREPKPIAPPTRQDRRGGRTDLRRRRAFITLMREELEYWVQDKPVTYTEHDHINAIVAFTRIGFPEVDAEIVRKTREPTTREGREQARATGSRKRRARPREDVEDGFPPLVEGADSDLPPDL
jgi:hypothetical protein